MQQLQQKMKISLYEIVQKNERHLILHSEICRVQQRGRPPGRNARLLDVYNEKPVHFSAKVSIPIREHPKVSLSNKNASFN